MTATAGPPLTTGHLIERLRVRYPPTSHVVLEEVRNGAGFSATRSADVLVMSLWPSRGLLLEGFEVKQDRRDWLRELKDPAKAESMFAYCDRWWLLTNPDVVRLDELPPTWGLLVAGGGGRLPKLLPVRIAPDLEPRPLTRTVLAAILKRAWGARPGAQQIAEERRIAFAEGQAAAEHQRSSDRAELQRLREQVQVFEQASGLRIANGWHLEQLGANVKRYLEDGMPGAATLRDYRVRLARILTQLDELMPP